MPSSAQPNGSQIGRSREAGPDNWRNGQVPHSVILSMRAALGVFRPVMAYDDWYNHKVLFFCLSQ